jgi:hypothetical protein
MCIFKAHINKRGNAILTFTCVHHTIVAVEQQKVLYDSMFLCVCVCARARALGCVGVGALAFACACVALLIQHAKRMRHII